MKYLAAFALLLVAAVAQGQSIKTHEVNPDNTLTFRYLDRSAAKVEVSTDASLKPLAMTRGADGVWTVTTTVLKPQLYSYSFVVDGVTHLDPQNSDVRRNYQYWSSNILVPAATPAPWELAAIPHGRVDHHVYTTHVAQHLPLDQNAYSVYTPPGYDPKRKGGYPVLYLLHGWSDDETGWIEIGHAGFILDSLFAAKKAVPMIVVMPRGYGDFQFVTQSHEVWNKPAKIDANSSLYAETLESEVMPAVEREYNIAPGRQNHAIIGLSMGGLESLYVGLNHTAQFAWVGGMSAAIHQEKFNEHLPGLNAKKADLRLLWVACGTDDGLIQPNRDFVSWAKEKGLNVTAVETPGAHTWLVWRENLLAFAPLLFR